MMKNNKFKRILLFGLACPLIISKAAVLDVNEFVNTAQSGTPTKVTVTGVTKDATSSNHPFYKFTYKKTGNTMDGLMPTVVHFSDGKKAYCIDPSVTIPKGPKDEDGNPQTPQTCDKFSYTGTNLDKYKYILGSSQDDAGKGLALTFTSINSGEARTDFDSFLGACKYILAAFAATGTSGSYSYPMDNGKSGTANYESCKDQIKTDSTSDGNALKDLLEKADDYKGEDNKQNNKDKITPVSLKEGKNSNGMVTLEVTLNKYVKNANIDVKCNGDCTITGAGKLSGSSTVTISAKDKDSCPSYTATLTYNITKRGTGEACKGSDGKIENKDCDPNGGNGNGNGNGNGDNGSGNGSGGNSGSNSGCNNVSIYICGAEQRFIACDDDADGGNNNGNNGGNNNGNNNGNGNQVTADPNCYPNAGGGNNDGSYDNCDDVIPGKTLSISGAIKCDNNQDDGSCDIDKDSITEAPVEDDIDGLCTEEGTEVIQIHELGEQGYEKEHLSNMNSCVFSGNEFLHENINKYCATYCIEDYNFFAGGLLKENPLTAGSYFTFDFKDDLAKFNVNAIEKNMVKCYTTIDQDQFHKDVAKAADDYCKSIEYTRYKCSTSSYSATDSYGNTVTRFMYHRDGEELTCSYTYDASSPYAQEKFTVKIDKKKTKIDDDSSGFDDSGLAMTACNSKPKKEPKKTEQQAESDYKSEITQNISSLKECVEAAEKKYESSCESTFEFVYGYKMPIYKIKGDQERCPTDNVKDNEKCEQHSYWECQNGQLDSSGCQKQTHHSADGGYQGYEKELDLGVSGANDWKFKADEYIYHTNFFRTKYDASGLNICNNYKEGEMYYTGKDERDAFVESGGSGTPPVVEVTKEKEEQIKTECENSSGRDGTTLIKGWPITYDTPHGEYKYKYYIYDYGKTKQDSCKRLVTDYDDLEEKDGFKGCSYIVNEEWNDIDPPINCTNCEWLCNYGGAQVPSEVACDPDIPECNGDCIWSCIGTGCIYDVGNGLALNYQPISLLNFDETFGYLQDKYSNVIAVSTKKIDLEARVQKLAGGGPGNSINWGTEKGKTAFSKIDEAAETIYNNDPDYKIKLTVDTLRSIKDYNETQKDKGGYLNQSLTCRNNDFGVSDYVTCTSDYLDTLDFERRNNNFEKWNGEATKKSGTGPAWK